MKEIVNTTGLSKGAFYHHFSSKEELFKEIVLMFFSMGTTDYTKFPQNSLNDFLKHYIKHTEESFKQINLMIGGDAEKEVSFNFFFIMFEAVNRFPEFLVMEKEMYHQDLNAWELVIENAKQRGEIKSQTSNTDIANLFLYCTDGVFIRVVNSDKKIKYTTKLEEAFQSIYNNLRT